MHQVARREPKVSDTGAELTHLQSNVLQRGPSEQMRPAGANLFHILQPFQEHVEGLGRPSGFNVQAAPEQHTSLNGCVSVLMSE